MKKKIALFLFDGFSDWEIAYITPEINRSEQFALVAFSVDGKPVTSMGGLHISPTASLADLKTEELDLLILPGGTAWEKGELTAIDNFTLQLFAQQKPIAAICAATTYLAQLGLLDDLNHTSNDLHYLKGVASRYRGAEHYQNALAVTDRNIITAKGIAPIEFAREIFKTIGLYDAGRIEQWFQLFKNGIWSE